MRILVAVVCWTCLVALSPVFAAEGRTPDPGTLRVAAVREMVLHDAARGKDLKLRVSYPAGDGPFPVVVWSHGAFGTKDNYQPLVEFWASHGYVVVQPNHSDSRAEGVRPGDPAALRDWQSRPADVRFG
jgi:predicted dienelactone hydrolase